MANGEKMDTERKTAKAPTKKDTRYLGPHNRRTFFKVFGIGAAAVALGGCAEKISPNSPSGTPSPGIGGEAADADPSVTATASKTPKSIETKTQTPTPEFDWTKVNIFVINTYPPEVQQFLKFDWIHSEDPIREKIQAEIEKGRAAFFAKEGIDVSRYKNINENERSLWGMIEWYTKNPDKVKAENLKIIVTPTEYEHSLKNLNIGNTFLEVAGDNGKITYGVNAPLIEGSFYTTDLIGRRIAGKDKLELPRGGLGEASGAFFGLGVVGAGENQGKVGIMDIIDKYEGKHNLFIFAIPEVDLVLPKGYVGYYLDQGGPLVLDEDYPVGQKWKEWGEDDDWFLTKAIGGKNIKIAFVFGGGGRPHFDAPHPILGGEMVADIRGRGIHVPYSPWGEQLEPLATKTPVATSA